MCVCVGVRERENVVDYEGDRRIDHRPFCFVFYLSLSYVGYYLKQRPNKT